ncbi:GAF domain-containing protein [Pseudonocardia halophobica]|uniref:GAF domain-containing protein n=1 Tax=Pseudonocardia halophobica TaxID=29401 RepID=UPI003D8ABFB3
MTATVDPSTTPAEARALALDSLGVHPAGREGRFDRITRLAQKLFGVEIAAVTVVDADTQWVKSAQGLDIPYVPLEDTFCKVTLAAPAGQTVIEDARADDRFADSPFVRGDPHVRFYAGHPLTTSSGVRVGTLCLIDPAPRGFGPVESTMLAELADWAEAVLRPRTSEMERAAQVQQALLPQAGSIDVPGYEVARARRRALDGGGPHGGWGCAGAVAARRGRAGTRTARGRGRDRGRSGVAGFSRSAGVRVAIEVWYAAWAGEPGFDPARADAAVADRAPPMLTWEPWDPAAGAVQPDYAPGRIAAGAHDAYIASFARQVRDWGGTLALRLMHEADAPHCPWTLGVGGTTRPTWSPPGATSTTSSGTRAPTSSGCGASTSTPWGRPRTGRSTRATTWSTGSPSTATTAVTRSPGAAGGPRRRSSATASPTSAPSPTVQS